MNQQRPIDERLSRWFLEEAPAEIPDRVLQATFDRTRVARQHRPVLGWRVGQMFPRAATAAAIVAAVAVAAVGMAGIGRPSDSVGGPAAPSPTVRPSPDRSFETPSWTLRYRLPNGWRVDGQTRRDIALLGPSGWVVIGGLVSAVDPDSTYVVYPDLDESVNTSVDGYLAWLDTHPRVDATQPQEVTVGTRRAVQVDVTLKPGQNYAQGSTPSRLGLAYFGPDTAAVGPTNGETNRFLLLEISGETVVIDLFSSDMAAFAPEVQPLLDSFVFEE